jgi:hypothetical protein
VYEAFDSNLHRVVALKLPQDRSEPARRARVRVTVPARWRVSGLVERRRFSEVFATLRYEQ